MGGKLGAGGGPMGDINVTPLIDVVLVLLVVFMVVTPMLSSGLPVDLPKATTTVQVNDVGQHIVISLTEKGEWAVEQEMVEDKNEDALIRLVQEEFNKRPETSILVKADQRLPYGDVRELMDILAEHRFTTVFIAAGKEG